MKESGPPLFPRPHLVVLGVAFLLGVVPEGRADPAPAAPQPAQDPRGLTELSPDELMRIEVTSVSRKPETRWRTPAAVAVITRDDIRRSGVTTLVEALRLAPGLQVARIDSNKWAVGVRGFASSLTRSVLVLIDGRSVYTPLFAGTFWEMQDVLLEDVERIEVIRGPGGSLWGANAVNGVINVITRHSRETPGAYAAVGGGTVERAQVGARYGGASGKGLTYRVYAKAFDRGPAFHPGGREFDAWSMGQAGFRADWERGTADSIAVHGDVYRGHAGNRTTITSLSPPFTSETVDADTRLRGGNLVARWRHLSASGTDWGLRTYYDRTDRRETTFGEQRDTFDLEGQRRRTYGRHDLVVGAGYRLSSGKVDSVPTVQFEPPRRTDHLWSGFFRDELSFAEGRYVLAVGSKVEHNGYSGFEVQPTLQALWAPTPRHSLWAAAARAVRTPSRVEHDLTLTSVADARTPVFIRIAGDEQFRPEKILTLEVGYRVRLGSDVALYGVAFHNTHRDLLSAEQGTPQRESSPPERVVIPLLIRNGVRGSSYGVEVAAQTSLREWWHVGGSYSFLRFDLERASGSNDLAHEATNGSSPRHMALLESRVGIGRRTDFDVMLRLVDALPARDVAAYTTLDARLAWRPRPSVELAAVGQNLLEPHHLEFPGSGGRRVEVRRGVYGTVTWTR